MPSAKNPTRFSSGGVKVLESKSGIITVWITVLLFLFALGILYITFLYVFESHLIPVIGTAAENTITDPTALTTVTDGITKYMTFFKIMPFILVFVAILYGIAHAIHKQAIGGYQ
jgi:hypothetical protein